MVFLTGDSSKSICTTALTIKVLCLDEVEVAYTFSTYPNIYIETMDYKLFNIIKL
jgi:hypothetical protein